MLVYHTTISASALLHNLQLYRVMRAPSQFFDTTPTGRVVQRFSKDVDIMDEVLPLMCEDLLICAIEVLGSSAFSLKLFLYVALVVEGCGLVLLPVFHTRISM